MKYSFVFSFRDRHDHLAITLPRVHAAMVQQDIEHELIVVEQQDTKKFRRANLLNEGVKYATGQVVVLHDIDYYPASLQQIYYVDGYDAYLPVRRVEFVNNDLTPRDPDDVPRGYRHFKISVDANFFGGVSTFTKEAFLRINGFSTRFVGWGAEDADLRERTAHAQLRYMRSDDNVFYALTHPDSGPAPDDTDFHQNMALAHAWSTHLDEGINTQVARSVELQLPDTITTRLGSSVKAITRWIGATEFDPPLVGSNRIVASTFNFHDL